MSAPEFVYSVAAEALAKILPLLERGDGKLARGLRGRRDVLERMGGWAESSRDPARPLVWFHASSVGEGLQAAAVLDAFRARRPDAQVVYTFFSPSAEGLARRVAADFSDYLPLDTRAATRRALDLLRPDVIAFSKYDVWPNLVAEAERRGVRTALLSGTLPASSSRLRAPARVLLRGSYERLDAVAAISAEDAERFALLGVAPERRSVMGDARFDQVFDRAAGADPTSELLRPLVDSVRRTLVAGSTWELDEERLVEAWARLGPAGRRLILVPHEPAPEHLERTERLLTHAALSASRLSDPAAERAGADVLLVDRVGVLGELYALADVAYVGGGWGKAGIHSVLEPAAFGAPVLCGPRHGNAREAAELIAAGGGFEVTSTDDLLLQLRTLLGDESARTVAGASARRYVQRGLGAASRGADVVERLLGPGERGNREQGTGNS